jgi:hypothetical protein
MSRNFILVAALLALPACDRESPERVAARKAAHRDACIAEELAVQANTQISQLDTMRAGADAPNPLSSMIYPFARAYYDFAKARERQLSLMDSAAIARTPEDSTRFAQRAAQAAPHAPSSQVEDNAAKDYQRHFADAMGNPAHPCNQEPESER